eukprot:2591909-Alexandrium_andersonii.AAC.1
MPQAGEPTALGPGGAAFAVAAGVVGQPAPSTPVGKPTSGGVKGSPPSTPRSPASKSGAVASPGPACGAIQAAEKLRVYMQQQGK